MAGKPTDLEALARSLADATAGRSIDVAGQNVRIQEVFTTDLTQAVLYSLRSGQTIPRHHHTGIDDIFLGVRGSGRVRKWREHGQVDEIVIAPGSIHVVTPGTVHELVSDSDDFAYLLLQAPKEDYDLVAEESTS
jgi:quercetin dioxygenase-like cupin family protein